MSAGASDASARAVAARPASVSTRPAAPARSVRTAVTRPPETKNAR